MKLRKRIMIVSGVVFLLLIFISAPLVVLTSIVVFVLGLGVLNIIYRMFCKLFRMKKLFITALISGFFVSVLYGMLVTYFLCVMFVVPFALFYLIFGDTRKVTSDHWIGDGNLSGDDTFSFSHSLRTGESHEFILYGAEKMEDD